MSVARLVRKLHKGHWYIPRQSHSTIYVLWTDRYKITGVYCVPHPNKGDNRRGSLVHTAAVAQHDLCAVDRQIYVSNTRRNSSGFDLILV